MFNTIQNSSENFLSFFFIDMGLIVFTLLPLAYFAYLTLLEKTAGKISKKNFPISAKLVWIAFLPIFGMPWLCYYMVMLSKGIVKQLAESKNYDTRIMTFTIATVFYIFIYDIVTYVLFFRQMHDDMNTLESPYLSFFLLFLMFIICGAHAYKINNYRKRLPTQP